MSLKKTVQALGLKYESQKAGKERRSEAREFPKAPRREDVEEPVNTDILDALDRDSPPPEEINPLKEMRQLINRENIDVKTVLTEKQVLVMHRIGNVYNIFQEEADRSGDPDALECASIVSKYAVRFFELSISKNGLSREQFIKAIHKAEERQAGEGALNLNAPVLKVQ